MSARSMTGFARVRRAVGSMEAVVSVKSVNHRGLDVHFHMPPLLDPFEPVARMAVKRRVDRGHVQVQVQFEKSAAAADGTGVLNLALLERWMAAFREASRRLGSVAEPDPNVAMRVPGMLASESAPEWSGDLEKALTEAFEEALDGLNEFRKREGGAIAREMRERAAAVEAITWRMEEIRSTATGAFQARLNDKLAELLRGAVRDPQRIAQEAAILAERSDISEEIMRLRTHAGQLAELIDAPGEKGKKLDFLLQEMNRESNTILSKTGGLADYGLTITDLGLAAKAEIDKMREQSLNLE